MRLNTKIVVDLANNRLVTTKKVRATECLAWCSRDHVFSMKTAMYPYGRHVAEALEGYRSIPKFPLVELATHAWFAGRSDEVYSPHLLAIGFEDRQNCSRLSETEQRFIDRFAQAIAEDLKPIINIVCSELKKELPDEDDRVTTESEFSRQLAKTFEWVAERHLNFGTSPVIPKGMKTLGEALVPFIDVVPHAEKHLNTVVCVTSNDCDESAVKGWAEDVGISDPELYQRPVLLLATRNIPEGRPLFRDCGSKVVGVTSGNAQQRLPMRRPGTGQNRHGSDKKDPVNQGD